MKRLATNKALDAERGFTLLEVLVAVLLLSIGLLGLASLQAWGLRATGNATYRSQATMLANEMIERVRANQTGAGQYNFTSGSCNAVQRCFGPSVECSSEQMAAADFFAVTCGNGLGDGAGMDDALPGGTMNVSCGGAGASCSVTVGWRELADADPNNTNGAARDSALRLVFVP